MRYIFTLFILTTLIAVNAFAMNDHSFKSIQIKTDTGKAASDSNAVKKQSVSAGVSYGSDASFFGRTNQTKYPFINSDVIYNTKVGIFIYGSAWKVLSSLPTVDEVDLGLGYSYKLSKNFKGSISYTRFLFSDSAKIIKSASSNDINFKNSFNWNILKTGVTLDYLFGKSDDFFVTISNSKYFESNWNIFDNKDYLTFEPSFNIILGTQNFVQKYSIEHDFFRDIENKLPPPLRKGKPPIVYEEEYSVANRTFNFLNYNIKIPLAYNRPHYTIEASYRYSIPVNVQGLLATQNESFFNLTFYYVFY